MKTHIQSTRNGDFHSGVLRQSVYWSTREKVGGTLCTTEDLKQDRDTRGLEDNSIDGEFASRGVLVKRQKSQWSKKISMSLAHAQIQSPSWVPHQHHLQQPVQAEENRSQRELKVIKLVFQLTAPGLLNG